MRVKKTNPFQLKNFVGIDPEVVRKLAECGIRTAPQMLRAGCTKSGRMEIAKEAGISPEAALELVRLSDLARLPGVKGIRARLYLDAGVTGIRVMAGWEAEPLRLMVTEYVEKNDFAGIPPLPKEVSSTIATARTLPILVEE